MATELAPLSLDRVTALFDGEGWNYDLDAVTQTIRTGFSGLGMEVRFIEPSIGIVTTVAVDTITADRFEEVLAWVEAYNYSKAFPSLVALPDRERNITALGATYSLPGYWQYTDAQFASHMQTGIQAMVTVSRDFLRDFAPEVLEQLDKLGS